MHNAYNTIQVSFFKGFHLQRRPPHGTLEQETHRKHPVLTWSWETDRAKLRAPSQVTADNLFTTGADIFSWALNISVLKAPAARRKQYDCALMLLLLPF